MEPLGIRVMKRKVGYMAFRRVLSIHLSPRAILAFTVFICLPVVLIRSNFDMCTRRYISFRYKLIQSRCTTNISNTCFSCLHAITIHQVIAIFLQFHCLRSYRNDYFPLQLIDQITFLLSRQMCHVN